MIGLEIYETEIRLNARHTENFDIRSQISMIIPVLVIALVALKRQQETREGLRKGKKSDRLHPARKNSRREEKTEVSAERMS